MPIKKIIPRQPDPLINTAADQEVAKFGHLNHLITQINANPGNGDILSDGSVDFVESELWTKGDNEIFVDIDTPSIVVNDVSTFASSSLELNAVNIDSGGDGSISGTTTVNNAILGVYAANNNKVLIEASASESSLTLANSKIGFKKVTLNSSDIINCSVTPIDILPTPGIGYFNDIISISVKYIYNSVNFTGITLGIIAKGNSFSDSFLIIANIFGAPHTGLWKAFPPDNTNYLWPGNEPLIENKELQITADVPGGAGDGSIVLYIHYAINQV